LFKERGHSRGKIELAIAKVSAEWPQSRVYFGGTEHWSLPLGEPSIFAECLLKLVFEPCEVAYFVQIVGVLPSKAIGIFTVLIIDLFCFVLKIAGVESRS
jgi:hypothetical protein